MRPRRRWPIAVAAVGAVLMAAAPRLGIGVNTSGSAPRALYRAVADVPARGALILACLPPAITNFGRHRGYLGVGLCPGGAQPVVKSIGAIAGDAVELGEHAVKVNGATLFTRPIEAQDSHGRSLPHITFGTYHVRDGEVWLFGFSDARSWDSRYFGPVPVSTMRTAVRPMRPWN